MTTGYLNSNPIAYGPITYAANGEALTVKDGANKLTTLIYKGFDRLAEVEFRIPVTGYQLCN